MMITGLTHIQLPSIDAAAKQCKLPVISQLGDKKLISKSNTDPKPQCYREVASDHWPHTKQHNDME